MVAKIRSISSAGNAGKYFYFLEKNYACAKEWQDNEVTKELGLKKLTRENFENILNGKIKNDVSLGRMTKDGLKHHPGQEIIFSAPKSVSVMAFVARDKRIIEAHEKAVSETLAYMNRHLIYSRVQEAGIQNLEKTNNTIIAKFTHMTSRGVKDASNDKKPDPQLHTHALIANATKCRDGEFRSIVFDKLYENQLNISELYRIELGRNIKDLGYNLTIGKDSLKRFTFEIEGVKDMAINELSQRRQDILEKAKERGVTDIKTIEYIAKTTREEKISVSQEELFKDWQQRVNTAELENTKDTALANISSAMSKSSNDSLKNSSELTGSSNDQPLDNLSFAISHLSEREAVWEATELHKTMWQKEPLDYSIRDIEAKINENASNVLQPYDKNNNNFTTKKNLILEKAVVTLMQDSQNKTSSIARTRTVDSILENTDLTIGQKDSVKLILTSKDRIVGVQGTAGTGKTTMLKKVRDIAKDHGIELIGLAPTKAASEVLKEAVEIDSKTLKSFTMRHDGVAKNRGTKSWITQMKKDFSNKIVILDEASLASSKDIKNLFQTAKRLNFKVVMVGDAKQQHGIEAGKPFYYLQTHGMDTAIQKDIKRQSAGTDTLKAVYQAEKAVDSTTASKNIYQALKAIGSNNISDLLDLQKLHSNSKGKGMSSITNQDLAERCYQIWQELKNNDVKNNDILVIAPSNDLRDKIGALIRKHYITGESQEFITLTNTYKTIAQISDIREYNGMEIVSFDKDIKRLDIKAGDIFRINSQATGNISDQVTTSATNASNKQVSAGNVNAKDKSQIKQDYINLIRISDNKKVIWNPATKNEFVSLYSEKNIELAKGDKIRWTKNSKKHSFIVNGETATIDAIDSKKIKIITGDGIRRNVSKEDMRFIDYGYTTSTYSAQGRTSDYVIGILRAKEKFLNLTHQRSFYVTLSRAAKEVHLVIDNYKDLIKSLGDKTGDKTSSIEQQSIEQLNKGTKMTDINSPTINQESTSRASLIKSTMAQLIKEYDNIEIIKENRNSLSSQHKINISDFQSQQATLSEVKEFFIKNSPYDNSLYALKKLNILVDGYGLTKARAMIENNIEILGELKGKKILFFNNKNRREALHKIPETIDILTDVAIMRGRLDVHKELATSSSRKYTNIYKSAFGFETKDINHSKMKQDITAGVKKSLWKIDHIESTNIINTISQRLEEKIIEYKGRYKKEPSILDKSQMFIKARYEYERKGFYQDKLNKENYPKTQKHKIKQFDKIDKLAKIDANLTKKGYGVSLISQSQNAVFKAYDNFELRIENLTDSYITQGYDKSQAQNIANKIVSFQIDNNTNPSINNLKTIENKSKTRTFNLDKTIISNMGINGRDAINLLSKIESIESHKANSKEETKELGFDSTSEVFKSNASRSDNSRANDKEQDLDKSQTKSQEAIKDREMEI